MKTEVDLQLDVLPAGLSKRAIFDYKGIELFEKHNNDILFVHAMLSLPKLECSALSYRHQNEGLNFGVKIYDKHSLGAFIKEKRAEKIRNTFEGDQILVNFVFKSEDFLDYKTLLIEMDFVYEGYSWFGKKPIYLSINNPFRQISELSKRDLFEYYQAKVTGEQ